MSKSPIVIAITIQVMLIAVSLGGCTTGAPAANNNTSTPAVVEPTLRPNLASSGTLPVSGHVYMDSKPVDGASVVAIVTNGSDSVATLTDGNGAYTLNLLPDTTYNVTAYSKGLIRTITPVHLHNTNEAQAYYGSADVADKYDIVLTSGHNATIAGITRPGWILVSASPADGGPTVSNASNYSGQYAINVEPGVGYSLSAKDYYGQMRYVVVNIYYRNLEASRFNYQVSNVTANPDETVLVDVFVNSLP